MMPLNTFPKILTRVDTNGPGGCWIWTGAKSGVGYGITAYQRERVLVHRLVYEHFVGPIPAGLQLDHLCRVRHCCNPTHLEAVTSAENNLRATPLTRTGYCRAGLHDITQPGSTFLRSTTNKRTCAECRRATKRRSYHRLKATQA